MGEKEGNGKEFEVPWEAKEHVEGIVALPMFARCSKREVYRALKDCQMELVDAAPRLFIPEIKETGEGEGGGEEREGRGANGVKGESRAFLDCPEEVPMPKEKVEPLPIALKKKQKEREKAEVPIKPKEKVEPFLIAPKKNKKKMKREKMEVPMEPKKKVEHFPVAPKEEQMKKREGRAFPDCPKQLTKHSTDRKWTPSTQFINLLEKEKAKTRAGIPAEWKGQVESIKEILKETEPNLTKEENYEMLEQCDRDPNLTTERLFGNSLENLLRCSIPSIRNDSPDPPSSPFHRMTYGSMERPAMMSMNAPPFAPSAAVDLLSQTLLRGYSLFTGREFTHPHIEPSYDQPQLPLQHGCMNHDGYMHQNFGDDMTSPQQEMYQGGSSSQANADPSSWGSFPGRGSTPHRFLPNSPAPSDTSIPQLNCASHVQVQHQQGNDYHPIGTNYDFAVQNYQPDPGAMSALPEQQQGGFPRWVPLPCDGINQHHDMPLAQQELYKGGSSSIANGNASGWGTIQGTGSTSYQSPLIPPYSPAPFNISCTGHDSTLQAQDEYINDDSFFILPAPALTPHGSYMGMVPPPANGLAGEGSSQQYVHQGYPTWHHPGMRIRPNHQQQSPHKPSTGNLQDFSKMQPPQDLRP
ncbi:uncharacterized protein LOC104425044 isoform X1 [Eucalyptus grandis]|uniref:uncharacterized protein LOC104425044 isoform X1 n=1 Tax=Eucalyptus grandis TaxID=71139 RepID=UPI00192EAD2D|nr:uncharacterized protein LOC104425044 isoform X1 [Eucalyptus grandis]